MANGCGALKRTTVRMPFLFQVSDVEEQAQPHDVNK